MANKIQKIFFFFFILLLPLQTRLILTPGKTEFLTFSIYLSEIFLWLALGFWLARADLGKIRIPRVFLFFCFFVFLSIAWSSDRVAAFRLWLFVFDGIVAYIFLREYGELRGAAVKCFLFSMFVAAIFGIWQFFHLSSPVEKWLGLAARGAWNLGDIVVAFDGERWLRAYGPFPHPNIFGGYLAAAILLVFVILRSRAEESRDPSLALRMTTAYIFLSVFLLALFLTFSRGAWLALVIAAVYFLAKNYNRETKKLFIFSLIFIAAMGAVFWPFLKTRATSSGRLEGKSNTERLASWREGLTVWWNHPIFGAGKIHPNPPLQKEGAPPFEKGRLGGILQPPHNIFILILAELGLLGFLIYLFLWRNFWKNPAARPLLILFFVIGFFDHYLWTLWSGQILFWTTAAFLDKVE